MMLRPEGKTNGATCAPSQFGKRKLEKEQILSEELDSKQL